MARWTHGKCGKLGDKRGGGKCREVAEAQGGRVWRGKDGVAAVGKPPVRGDYGRS
jgi:hypothetical protein